MPDAEYKALTRHRDTMEMRRTVEKYDPDQLRRFDAVYGALVVMMQFFLFLLVRNVVYSYEIKRVKTSVAREDENPT